jgi:hypothetical protein
MKLNINQTEIWAVLNSVGCVSILYKLKNKRYNKVFEYDSS